MLKGWTYFAGFQLALVKIPPSKALLVITKVPTDMSHDTYRIINDSFPVA